MSVRTECQWLIVVGVAAKLRWSEDLANDGITGMKILNDMAAARYHGWA